MIDKLEIAGPGFLNITLKTSFLEKEIEEMMRDSHYGVSKTPEKERVIVEFSSRNSENVSFGSIWLLVIISLGR